MSEANEVPENCKKLKYIFKSNLRLPESFKTMNWPDSTLTALDGLFLGKFKIKGRAILTQSSFKSSICDITIWIDIFDSLKTMSFSTT